MDGEVDSASIPKDSFDQAISGGVQNAELTEEMRKKGIKLHTIRDPSTFWLGFNMEDPVVGDNKPLRRAMSLAIDREDYVDLLLNGRGEPAHGLFPPVFEGVYNEDLKSPHTKYDPDRARELLKRAREVHGGELPTLELYMPGTDPTSRQHGTFLSRAWENIGLDVRTEHMDWPTFQRTVDNKSAQIFQMGWLADFPDPENFLMLYYGPNEAPGPNHTNYKNEEFDKLYRRMKSMPKGPERVELAQRMEQMVVEDMPNAFINHRIGFALRYDWLKNYKLPVWASGTYKYQKIDTELRRERVGR
jgi:ABC-type transport system substrate-binding protein